MTVTPPSSPTGQVTYKHRPLNKIHTAWAGIGGPGNPNQLLQAHLHRLSCVLNSSPRALWESFTYCGSAWEASLLYLAGLSPAGASSRMPLRTFQVWEVPFAYTLSHSSHHPGYSVGFLDARNREIVSKWVWRWVKLLAPKPKVQRKACFMVGSSSGSKWHLAIFSSACHRVNFILRLVLLSVV